MKHWRELLALTTLVLIWAAIGIAPRLSTAVYGLPNMIDYLRGSYPPDWSVIPTLQDALLETVQMGILGVTIGTVVAAPLSFLAAKETTPWIAMYVASRAVINVARAIPTLLWAILFVTMVGLGPAAGIFAIATHCVGSLGKYFSESIETVHPRIRDVLEAMEVDGATKGQSLVYGLIPAVAPLFASYFAYYVEWSLRTGTILGLVGAGGLGLRLTMSIRLFKRQETAAIVLTILVMVLIADALSRMVRKQLLEDTI